MSSEEKRFVKWVIILIACIVAAVITTTLVMLYCPATTEHETATSEIQPLPERIVFTAEQYNSAARSGGTTSVKVQANVEPYNAENSKVDFAAAWKNAPSSYAENVTDYVTVRQESDGSQTATITCIKPFTQYNVAITVTTRDGGYTAECLCTFSGKATSIDISVDGKELTTDSLRGTFYMLDSKKVSTVRLHATNAYDYVTDARYTVSVSVPNVSLWFGDCDYGEYGEVYFNAVRLEKLQDKYKAGKLFTVSGVNNGSFTITTKAAFEWGAETVETTYDEYGLMYRHGKNACVYDPFGLGIGSSNGIGPMDSKNEYNVAIIDSLCYEIVVTEQVSGISETMRFWVSI